MPEKLLFETLLKKAMVLCAGREVCRSEIKQKLLLWGANEKEAEKLISRLVYEKFIDEQRYSLAFTRDRFRYNGWGKIKIAAALRMKGIKQDTISVALETIDDETYISFLKDLMAAQRRKIKAKNQYDLKGKLFRFALSRGFESHLLYDILNEND